MAAAGPGRPVVLVVEDDTLNRETLASLLEAEGFVAFGAANGQQALAMLAREPIDVITLDMMMPVMNGWEFLRERERFPEYRHIPVVVLTAVGVGGAGTPPPAPADPAAPAPPIGSVATWLAKPTPFEELVEAVRRAAEWGRQERGES